MSKLFNDGDDSDAEDEEFQITEIVEFSTESGAKKKPLVIPLRQNGVAKTQMPVKQDLKFVTNVDKDGEERTQWGLQVQKRTVVVEQGPSAGSARPDAPHRSVEEEAIAALLDGTSEPTTAPQVQILPLLQQGALPELADILDPIEKYHKDVSLRPAESTLEDYEDTPIDDFGAAILRGMGWEEGRTVGRNQSGALAPVVLKNRPHLLGLGADPTLATLRGGKGNRPRAGSARPDISNGGSNGSTERAKPHARSQSDRPDGRRGSSRERDRDGGSRDSGGGDRGRDRNSGRDKLRNDRYHEADRGRNGNGGPLRDDRGAPSRDRDREYSRRDKDGGVRDRDRDSGHGGRGSPYRTDKREKR